MSDVLIPTWNIGDRLAKSRREAGIPTAIEMAGKLGVTERTIRNWEGGVTPPKRAALIAWSTITKVPVEWLEHGEEGAPEALTEEYQQARFIISSAHAA